MQPGIWQILIVAVVILILFGRGRISEMMGDFGKGISSFKKGMSEENKSSSESGESSARIEGPAHEAKPAGETAETAPSAPSGDKTGS